MPDRDHLYGHDALQGHQYDQDKILRKYDGIRALFLGWNLLRPKII